MTRTTVPSLDPDAFHDDAVRAAMASKVEGLSTDLKLIRLICALHDGDEADFDRVRSLLEVEALGGYPLFQLRTAILLHAARSRDRAGFDTAWQAWIAGRQAYPGNWDDAVLDEDEIRPWITAPPKPKPDAVQPVIEKDDLIFVKDLSFAITRAVQDNLLWLKEQAPAGSVADLVDHYRLASVDRSLKEATLTGRGELPDLIVALDDQGSYRSSFIAH
jgi:hypothetical protein